MHKKNIHTASKSLQEADKVLIMIHGRGGGAQDILGITSHLKVEEYAIIAPEATNNTWYPYSFMAPPEQNEPWLSSALNLVKELVDAAKEHNISAENIYFLGFSQGACLALEFIARNAENFGGVVALTGGLIGDKLDQESYSGSFNGMPIFMGTGNPDPFVPIERVKESAKILEKMNAKVHLKVYEGKAHNVSKEEIDEAKKLIFERA